MRAALMKLRPILAQAIRRLLHLQCLRERQHYIHLTSGAGTSHNKARNPAIDAASQMLMRQKHNLRRKQHDTKLTYVGRPPSDRARGGGPESRTRGPATQDTRGLVTQIVTPQRPPHRARWGAAFSLAHLSRPRFPRSTRARGLGRRPIRPVVRKSYRNRLIEA
jgi:hypothetical protein